MQRLLLIGEEQKRGRSGLCLGDVVNADGPGLRCGATLKIDAFKPAVELGRGNAEVAGGSDFVNEREKPVGALAGLCGKEDNGRVAEEFELLADELFVIAEQSAAVDFRGRLRDARAFCFALR